MENLSSNAVVTFEKRICARDEEGNLIETPAEALWRVAANVGAAEWKFNVHDPAEITEKFYGMMSRLEFLPNSPCLVNAGRPLQQLAACFVLPVGDSIDEIFDAVKQAALIHKSGGGTGFGFGRLRPAGDTVASTGRVASGPVSFMKVFDAATESIKQGGVRRGANMGVLPIDHPDIEEFVSLKRDNSTLSNFNISVAVTDEFMECLREDKRFPLRFNESIVRYVDPRTLWDTIAESAWISGDPGLLFIDRINRGNAVPNLGDIEATNPCGEVPLLPNHTCNLGSIDVAKFILPTGFDYPRLKDTVHLAVRFLDNIIEMNHYPTPEIAEATRQARKIGLGIMGWADALILLGIPYASQDARDLAEELMAQIKEWADEASVELARERGSYPAYDGSRNIDRFPDGIRNSSRTVMAPTGTLSILGDCSSGIEPLFALAFTKNVMDTQLTHVARSATHYIRTRLSAGDAQRVEDLLRSGVSPARIAGASGLLTELDVAVLATAHDIAPADHVLMQAAFQRYTDDSISKTINFPNSATVRDIEQAYMLAWDHGCKGITVYRDGCKNVQVLEHIRETPDTCSDCGGRLIHQEGCTHCESCGVSMCES